MRPTEHEIEAPPNISPDRRPDLGGLLPQEIEALVSAAGEPGYRARQVMHWIWAKDARNFDAMTSLPAALREYLKHNLQFVPLTPVTVTRSDDGTSKLLLQCADDERIESVIIPSTRRLTLCISTQAGCAMGCTFCATATMGLHRNLTAAEVVGQVSAARNELGGRAELTNYVFMGMGEPLANYLQLKRALAIMTAPWGMAISPRRITVSTVGLVPMMEKLLADTGVKLAVSLHATTNEIRDRLVPINRRYPLETLLEACRRLPLARRARITFEYVMLKGVNDSCADAARLIRLLAPLRAKVNLILFNSFSGAKFECSAPADVERFQSVLLGDRLTATVRQSRGRDIAGACGQLALRPDEESRAPAQTGLR